MDASTQPPAPSRKDQASDLRTAPVVELALRLGALGVLIYVAVTLIQPFIEVAIWSIVIAVALSPAYERLADWLGGWRRLAAALMTIACFVVIIGPATWLARWPRSPRT
jgi:predicted PurR-regulated permease PerM